MLKRTSLALGLLAIISVAPSAHAIQASVYPASQHQLTDNRQAQLTIILGGGQPDYNDNHHRSFEWHRLRRLERERLERERLEREREAQSRRYRYNSRWGRNSDSHHNDRRISERWGNNSHGSNRGGNRWNP